MEVKRKLPVGTEETFLNKVKLVEILSQELDTSTVPLWCTDGLTQVIEVTDLLGVHFWCLTVMLHDHILQHKLKCSGSLSNW